MDFEESILEGCTAHEVKPYSFDKLLKLHYDTRDISTEDVSPCSVESIDQFSFCPPVEFPLIKVLDENIKKTFDKMEEFLPPLPCELDSRKIRLGTIKSHLTSTLILEVSDLLTKVSERNEIVWRENSKKLVRQLSSQFEIVLFTTYNQEVTDRLMNELDKKKKLVTKVIGINSMIEREDYKIIDIRIFEDRNPNQIIVVASSLITLTGCLENGIYLELNEEIQDKLTATKEFLLNLPKLDNIKLLVKRFSGLIRIFKIYGREKSCYY